MAVQTIFCKEEFSAEITMVFFMILSNNWLAWIEKVINMSVDLDKI